VPESQLVLEVLAEMRRQRRAFAVVVDEHGGVEGVLTVKDLLGALVGDLPDEFDPGDEPEVVRVDARRWLVDGRMSVDDVRDRLDINLPEGEYVTLGGYLFDAFGHIPIEGEAMSVDGWELRVAEMEKRRIAKVVCKRPASVPEGSDPPPSADGAGTERTAVG
jgi:CBS domain containing-hemolysin-like protein